MSEFCKAAQILILNWSSKLFLFANTFKKKINKNNKNNQTRLKIYFEC